MNHPVETFGFRLEHAGRVIAYSADTGPTDRLAQPGRGRGRAALRGDVHRGPGAASRPAPHAHGRRASTRPGAEAGQLVLTHLMPWNSRERAQAEAAASYQGALSLAEPGQVL